MINGIKYNKIQIVNLNGDIKTINLDFTPVKGSAPDINKTIGDVIIALQSMYEFRSKNDLFY